MLLLDGQVHHDTHAVPMGNYVIGVGNYVIATPSELGNYMSADTKGPVAREPQGDQWDCLVRSYDRGALLRCLAPRAGRKRMN